MVEKKKRRWISVGFKLGPDDYQTIEKWADRTDVSVSAFVKGAVARRIAEFEITELREKLEEAQKHDVETDL